MVHARTLRLEGDKMDETFAAQPWPRGVLLGSGILALVVGGVALTPAPGLIRLAALAIAALVLGWTLYVLLPPPRLVLDDQGFTLHRRLARPRCVAWSEVESFEIASTPGMPVPLRILAFLTVLLLAPVGAISSDPTDTSEAAIGWRKHGRDKGNRMGGWIVGHFGLPQDELLARLNARLLAPR
jgi:hypothetical protein